MFGLIVSDPSRNETQRHELARLLYLLDLPLSAFTEKAAPSFTQDMSRAAFLRHASAVLLQPGQPLPLAGLLRHLSSSNPLPGNVLRKYLFLQLSLLPYLRPGLEITHMEGSFLLGSDLLVVPVSEEDTVDVQLPPGIWTELNGQPHTGRLRCMRGYNEMPVLARENALIPIGVNDRSTTHDDADRLTLHWFEPAQSAACILADGTRYMVSQSEAEVAFLAGTEKPCHLILHRNGIETLYPLPPKVEK